MWRKVANPVIIESVAVRGDNDDVIMPHATRRRIPRAPAMLRNKHVMTPARKREDLPK